MDGPFSLALPSSEVFPSTPETCMAGGSGGASGLAGLTEDLLRRVRETTSCSLLRLTIRWDMLRTIVPARCRVALAVLTDKERCKELDL